MQKASPGSLPCENLIIESSAGLIIDIVFSLSDDYQEGTSNQPMEVTPKKRSHMIITNIETVPGKTIVEHYGLVSGSTVRAKHIGQDIFAGLKNIVGGELVGYTELLNESRKQAIERMQEQAQMMEANAIVNVRFATSSVAQGASELYVYGTAVKVE